MRYFISAHAYSTTLRIIIRIRTLNIDLMSIVDPASNRLLQLSRSSAVAQGHSQYLFNIDDVLQLSKFTHSPSSTVQQQKALPMTLFTHTFQIILHNQSFCNNNNNNNKTCVPCVCISSFEYQQTKCFYFLFTITKIIIIIINKTFITRHDKQRHAVTSLECTVYELNCLNAIRNRWVLRRDLKTGTLAEVTTV